MSDATTAASLIAEARALDAAGKHQAGLVLALRAIAIFRQVASAEEDTAKALCTAAKIASSLNRDDEALAYRREAVLIFRKLYGDRDHSLFSSALVKFAELLKRLGCEPELARVLDAEGHAMHRRLECQALFDQGLALHCAGKWRDAIPVFQRALDKNRKLLGGEPDDAMSASMLRSMYVAHTRLGQHEAALAAQTEAVPICRRVFDGADREALANAIENLGAALSNVGRHEDALKLHTESLEMRRRLANGGDSDGVAESTNGFATSLSSLGRHGEALPLFEGALAMLRRLSGGRDSDILATAMMNVSNTLMCFNRDHERQRSLKADAVAMQTRLAGGKDSEKLAVATFSAAVKKDADGDGDGAMPHFTQSYEMLMRLFPNGHEAAAGSLIMRGCILIRDEASRDEGVEKIDEGLAMMRRVIGDSAQHANQARSVGLELVKYSRPEKGKQLIEEAEAMRKRLTRRR